MAECGLPLSWGNHTIARKEGGVTPCDASVCRPDPAGLAGFPSVLLQCSSRALPRPYRARRERAKALRAPLRIPFPRMQHSEFSSQDWQRPPLPGGDGIPCINFSHLPEPYSCPDTGRSRPLSTASSQFYIPYPISHPTWPYCMVPSGRYCLIVPFSFGQPRLL